MVEGKRFATEPHDDGKWDGEGHVYEWAGNRNHKFLGGLFRHSFQPSHSADRQQGDVLRGNSIVPGCQRVPKFVQDDDTKEKQDEPYCLHCFCCVLLSRISAPSDPKENQGEQEVDS